MRSLAFLLVLLAGAGCAASTGKPGAWSEAGRRAQARHAWHCSHQGTAVPAGGPHVVGGRARPHRRDSSCDPERFLCEQIHRGARATAEERLECANYEAVHGRVSGR